MNADLTKRADEACSTAEQFAKLYYERMDRARHQIGKLYTDEASLAWNGNGASGGERVQRFLLDLPATEHALLSLDAHPVTVSSSSQTVLIQAAGRVAFDSKPPQPFHQTFLVTAQDKWKIVSDCFRSATPPLT